MDRTNGMRAGLGTLAAVFLTGAGTAAQAAEPGAAATLTRPESTVSVGAGYVSSDNQQFGQYNGMTDQGFYGLFDIDFLKRFDGTGTWLSLTGRNLGLRDRELRVEFGPQGDWTAFVDYSQIPRLYPYTISTGLSGIGTASQTISGTGLRNVELETERKRITLGFDKWLPAGFDVKLRYQDERKDGARVFGSGNSFPDANFLTEPIDSTTRQAEVTLGYTGESLQLTGGYYGSFYDNAFSQLNVSGAPAFFPAPIALAPSNESHQLYVAGGYSFTPTTRSTFRAAYSWATQNDAFIDPGGAQLANRSSLDGQVNTTLLQAGLTSQPLPKLSLLANVRYQNRNDDTPIQRYTFPLSTTDGNNEPQSFRTLMAKLEATYRLPLGFRLTGAIDYDDRTRDVPPLRSLTYRQETEQTSYRAELRRSLAETINGTLAYVHSRRTGSDLLSDTNLPPSNLVAPISWTDRDRDLWRIRLDWAPVEPLSLNLVFDRYSDDYDGRALGPRDGEGYFVSVDAAYQLSDTVQLNAWAAWDSAEITQDTRQATTLTNWSADIRNASQNYGLGARWKPMPRLETGGDVTYAFDSGKHDLSVISGLGQVASLPEYDYRHTRLKLFARYAVRPDAGLKVEYVYDRWRTDDWTWTNWVYADGTVVTQDPQQTVNFIGVSGYYHWW